MRIAVMQPYLFPYIGYFQLVQAVDKFIILDNVQYINRGWINRNRILMQGEAKMISFSVCKARRNRLISERYFSDSFEQEKTKFFRTLQCAYAKAPYYEQAIRVIEQSLLYESQNIAEFITYNLQVLCGYIGIHTPLMFASQILPKNAKGEDYILALCDELNADIYINPIGGQSLYHQDKFYKKHKILHFLCTSDFSYKQFENIFIPALSIIDVMMFNDKDSLESLLERYRLL